MRRLPRAFPIRSQHEILRFVRGGINFRRVVNTLFVSVLGVAPRAISHEVGSGGSLSSGLSSVVCISGLLLVVLLVCALLGLI